MSRPEVSIQVDNLRVRYHDQGRTIRALDGVSLEVAAGEKVAVIGPSGGGKSTLIRVLAGLVQPTEGRVEVEGLRVDEHVDLPREHYRKVGLVFQNHGLVPQLTANKNVLCGRLFEYGAAASFDGEHRSRAADHLRRLGLGERLNVPVSRLSGGERQRVALARLLLQDPRLALLDEPISNLDVHWANQAIEALDALRDGGATVVMVAHDLDLARRWAGRVIYMRDGKIVESGDPDEVCSSFEHRDSPTTTPVAAATGSPNDRPDAAPESTSAPEAPSSGPAAALSPASLQGKSFYLLIVAALVGALLWAAAGVEFSISQLFGNLDNAADFMTRLFPPDFSEAVTKPVVQSLVETIQMALLGTSFAAIVSLPIAVMAARNISPGPLRAVARVVLNLLRTIPSIIWGLFFVAIVGLGPFPGILALTFYAAGYLGKFYYEGIESIDVKPLTALRTVGAGRIHRFRFGVLPQVLPLLLGYTLYMFEYNVRSASILGVVGAGGIGFYLYTYINNFNYAKATTALLLLLAVVTIIDIVSSMLRERLSDSR